MKIEGNMLSLKFTLMKHVHKKRDTHREIDVATCYVNFNPFLFFRLKKLRHDIINKKENQYLVDKNEEILNLIPQDMRRNVILDSVLNDETDNDA